MRGKQHGPEINCFLGILGPDSVCIQFFRLVAEWICIKVETGILAVVGKAGGAGENVPRKSRLNLACLPDHNRM